MKRLKIILGVIGSIIGLGLLCSTIWHYSPGGKAAQLRKIQHRSIEEQERHREAERKERMDDNARKRKEALENLLQKQLTRRTRLFFKNVDLYDWQLENGNEIIQDSLKKEFELSGTMKEIRKTSQEQLMALLNETQKRALQEMRSQNPYGKDNKNYSPQPSSTEETYQRFFRDLDLEEKQKNRALSLLDKRTRDLEKVKNELDLLRKTTEQQLVDLLTPEQKEQYEESKQQAEQQKTELQTRKKSGQVRKPKKLQENSAAGSGSTD